MVGQFLVAVAALAIAWPLLWESMTRLGIVALGTTLETTLASWILSFAEHWSSLSKSMIAFWAEQKSFFEMESTVRLPSLGLWLLVASASVTWLVGNGLVLSGSKNWIIPMDNGGEENQ
jgi:hypothetical protein